MDTLELFQIVRQAALSINAGIATAVDSQPDPSRYTLDNCTITTVKHDEPETNPIEAALVFFGPSGGEVYVVEIDHQHPSGSPVADVRYVWPHHCHGPQCNRYEARSIYEPTKKTWILKPPR